MHLKKKKLCKTLTPTTLTYLTIKYYTRKDPKYAKMMFQYL